MIAWRLLFAVPGLAAIGYGLWRVWNAPNDDVVPALWWLAGGVIAHDGVIAPVVVVLGVIAAHWLPTAWRAPAVVGLVCWGSVTLLAIPVLYSGGELPDNPTLLDRPYVTSWWIGTAATVTLVLAVGHWRWRRRPD